MWRTGRINGILHRHRQHDPWRSPPARPGAGQSTARQALRGSGRGWTVAFLRETQAGHHYGLEPKTCGIFWCLAVAEHILMADYCTPHTCIEAECSVPPRTPRKASMASRRNAPRDAVYIPDELNFGASFGPTSPRARKRVCSSGGLHWTWRDALGVSGVAWPSCVRAPPVRPAAARELHPLPWQRSARSQAFVPVSRGPPVLAVLSFEPVTWQQPSAAHTRMPED